MSSATTAVPTQAMLGSLHRETQLSDSQETLIASSHAELARHKGIENAAARQFPSPPTSPSALDADDVSSSEGIDVDGDGEDNVPQPESMPHLISLIKEELGPHGLDSSAVNVDRIVKLMERYASNAADWSQYALFDPYRYTRNLVDDGNGLFNMLVICWGPGHVSPIHDHANSHCCMKMLDGQLVETRYEYPSATGLPPGHVKGESEVKDEVAAKLCVIGEKQMARDEVVYINDSLGLHRVSNPTPTPAISLHLYTPPIVMCKTFCERTGAARPAGQCVYYSVGGKRVSPLGQSCNGGVGMYGTELTAPLPQAECAAGQRP